MFTANPGSGVALAPHIGWYIILYFFLGGLAGGLMMIAAMLRLVGDPKDHDAVRIAHRLAFPLIVVCTLLLIIDLGTPIRFWHMVFKSERFPALLLKPWSPISLGVWILTIYAGVAFVDYFFPDRIRHRAWTILGGLTGLALAGYTGVFLTATSIAPWHNARLLGALFLLSGMSSAYALLILLLPADVTTQRKLATGDFWTVSIEALVLVLMLIGLGSLGRVFWSGWLFGVIFWIGVVGLGLLAPLARHWFSFDRRRAAWFALTGGLLLRFVIIMSPQYPRVPLWHL